MGRVQVGARAESESPEPVRSWVEDRTGVIEITRPHKFNCLSTGVWRGMEAALDRFGADRAVRAVLVVSRGEHFCTGADLAEVLQGRAGGTLADLLGHGHRVLARLERTPLPVVAAVQGLALAGGLELMLACDVVLAARSARFGDQHAQFGLVPGWGGSQRLARIVGLRRAMDLFLSARWLDAEQAERYGLVNHVVADERLREAALEYCAALATRSRAGLAIMKKLARDGLDMSLAEGLAMEREVASQALYGADAGEGMRAFAEKRPPRFEG